MITRNLWAIRQDKARSSKRQAPGACIGPISRQDAPGRDKNPWVARQARAAARKAKRADNRRFIAKAQGKHIQPDRKLARKKLDDLTSMIVRLRDKKIAGGLCLVCLAKKRLGMIQDRAAEYIYLAYHIERRGKEAVRWDLDNIVGACRRCNEWERFTRYQNPDLVRRVHVEVIGEAKLTAIEMAGKAGAKYSTAEILLMYEQRKAMLEHP